MKKKIIFTIIITVGLITNSHAQNIDEIIIKWKKIIKEIKSYKYTPPRFNPFKPLSPQLKPAPINEKLTIFFKNYNINELKLVGIIEIKKKKFAIIEDPTGKGVLLKEGNYIGKEAGIITKISKCHVYISKKYIDERGNIIFSEQKKVLSLYSEEEKCLEK